MGHSRWEVCYLDHAVLGFVLLVDLLDVVREVAELLPGRVERWALLDGHLNKRRREEGKEPVGLHLC